ncbi:MAG: hypothetical protein HW412_2475, partial [Bacteroidetes bacterium]|nr:hypothetical protein [Bacteroidota bacterium]
MDFCPQSEDNITHSRDNLHDNVCIFSRQRLHFSMEQAAAITEMLVDLSGGNRAIVNALMPLVYEELHHIAQNRLRGERSDHTLNATALVNEAYLKLI